MRSYTRAQLKKNIGNSQNIGVTGDNNSGAIIGVSQLLAVMCGAAPKSTAMHPTVSRFPVVM